MRRNLKDYIGLALVILAMFALVMLVLAVVKASAHDQYDCVAAGGGTAFQCQQHNLRHVNDALPGPWILTVEGDMAGAFTTFGDCLVMLSRFGSASLWNATYHPYIGAGNYTTNCRR